MTAAFKPIALAMASDFGFDPDRRGLCIAMLVLIGVVLRAATLCTMLASSRHVQGKPPLQACSCRTTTRPGNKNKTFNAR